MQQRARELIGQMVQLLIRNCSRYQASLNTPLIQEVVWQAYYAPKIGEEDAMCVYRTF
jgi:hypothetical protein